MCRKRQLFNHDCIVITRNYNYYQLLPYVYYWSNIKLIDAKQQYVHSIVINTIHFLIGIHIVYIPIIFQVLQHSITSKTNEVNYYC